MPGEVLQQKKHELNTFKSGKIAFFSAQHPVVTCVKYLRGEELSTSDRPVLSGGTEKSHHKPSEVLTPVSAAEPLPSRVNAIHPKCQNSGHRRR